MNDRDDLDARRAVEALRAGVPNREAVRFLGAGQTRILRRFHAGLDALHTGDANASRGFIIGGEFGTGKSHQLERLKREGLDRGYAVSRIHVSKETALSDPDLVFKEALNELELPDRRGGDLAEVILRLAPNAAAYDEVRQTLAHPESTLDPLFNATFVLNERLSPDHPFREDIHAFWSGGTIKVTDVRAHAKSIRAPGLVVAQRRLEELLEDRFSFLALLVRAAGYTGWLLLLDEIELIARYANLGRARAYSNLMWLLGYGAPRIPHTFAVAAATREFTGEVFVNKRDHEKLPAFFRRRQPELAERVETALRALPESAGAWEPVLPLTDADLDHAYVLLRDLYRRAFAWKSREARRPPDTALPRSIRVHVREWIARFDLERIDPQYAADIASETLEPDFTETPELEGRAG